MEEGEEEEDEQEEDRIHTCNTINILIGHQLYNDDFINDGKCFYYILSLFCGVFL